MESLFVVINYRTAKYVINDDAGVMVHKTVLDELVGEDMRKV